MLRRALGALAVTVFVSACATPQADHFLGANGAEGLPERVELTAVPFHPQQPHRCAETSLAMVLRYAGADVTPESLSGSVYVPGREGALDAEVLATMRRSHFVAYPLEPRMDEVFREVASGTPVIVMMNLGLMAAPVWHYAVVIGYDRTLGEVILRSGITRRMTMPLSQFEHVWKRSGYWAAIAASPDRLPATAREDAWARAAAALERTSVRDARRAYATALNAWPHNLVALIGFANAAYAMGDVAAAETALRNATTRHPKSADAWNNLAHVLTDQRRYGEALVAARRAEELGGARRDLYVRTLANVPR